MAGIDLGTLTVNINADTSRLQSANRQVTQTTNQMGQAFNRLGAIIAGALSVTAAKNVIQIADNMSLLEIRVRNATKSSEEFNKSYQRLIDISRETGSTLATNIQLFEQLAGSAAELGATNPQVLQLTESLNKLGVIGGSSQEQMKNAMLQLSQAMSLGVLKAEEFNSIVENTPAIARAMAEGLGLSLGEMRELVLAGELLGGDVFNSILSQVEKTDREFKKMPDTVGKASQAVATNFALVVAEINNGINATERFAGVIKSFADSILELPNDIRVVFGALFGAVDRFFAEQIASFKLLKLLFEKTFTLSSSGKAAIDEQVAEVIRVRDIRIAASNAAVSAIIRNEAQLVAAKRIGSAGTGGDVGLVPEKQVEAEVESDKERLKRIKDQKKKEAKAVREGEREKLRIEKAAADQRRQFTANSLNALDALNKAGLVNDKATAAARVGFAIVQNVAEATKVGFPQNIPLIVGAVAQGVSLSKMLTGGGRQFGGDASPGLAHPINEAGVPEILTQGSRQFLLPTGQGGKITPMGKGGGGGGGGMPQIVINNNAPGVSIETQSVTMDQVVIVAREQAGLAADRINSSLATGRGESFNALQQSTNIQRNLS
ncbi:tape measure protein [Candidatus Pacearchaeota archaeon]|nr:tape measure protein [Candidatus Pacearchaeota archaeon]